ncbi:phosphohistidine phosphatase [Arachidicoccus rhizosphaerae]|jgi:phosphohistidine phosphatase|uniref:Phosphohistidine phosphatase n=1 Tax=Arachidicoccus rhizosphaerae TaxID=551991 RepID=A0A1H4BZY0_9BACT|nr:histidine phosphatase family protein [Arachidicoccus rhizosphaerae]SEA53649.1 phosphohistidine phosphatase [Arachidicoccus rhizosphaerae]
MKELLVIRHAKSSWQNPWEDDFDRPLNDRGKRDAPFMAAEIQKKGVMLDALISSDANRAFSTCVYFGQQFPGVPIIKDSRLYQANVKNFFEVIHSLSDDYQRVALFSHNTGLTDFVNRLTKVRVDIVPTCGIYGVKADIDHWTAFKNGKKAFWFFDYPKNHLIR